MIFTELSVRLGLFIALSSILSIFLSAYALQRKHIQGATGLSIFMVTTALFSIGYAFEINSDTLSQILDFLKFEQIWASLTAPAYFMFILQFIKKQKSCKGLLIFLFTISIIISFFGITLDRNHLYLKNYHIRNGDSFPVIIFESGPVHIIQLIFLISLSLIGEIIMIVHFLKSKGIVRVQSGLIIVAGLMPTISAMMTPHRTSVNYFDTLPFAFFITGILMALSLFRFQMLDFVRISREFAVDSIKDLLVIIDKNRIIQDINRAGRQSDLLKDFIVGLHIPDTTEFSKLISHEIENLKPNEIGICQYSTQSSHYKCNISSVYENGKFRGFSLLINNNTNVVNLLKELEFHAIYDGLTGIFNRRHFMALANRELDLCKRKDSAAAVIIFDIDHFKRVNDTFGHLIGDNVLKKIADVMRVNLRSSEIFCRFGGEEFCIFCSDITEEESWLISERIRNLIEKMTILYNKKRIYITASFGIFHNNDCFLLNLEASIGLADKALYQAKKSGRNRSVIYREKEMLPEFKK